MKTSKSILFFLFLAVVSTDRVLGQIIEYSAPKRLSEAINSSDEESLPMASPDGKTLYFVRTLSAKNVKGKLAGQDIWQAKQDEKGNWLPSVNVEPLNTKGNNAVIGRNKKGDMVYLLNNYKGGKTSNKGISYSTSINGKWTPPTKIPLKEITIKSPYYGFYMHPSEKIVLISMDGEESLGNEDLYVILKDSAGKWGNPVHLGSTLNTLGFEISPFLSEDGTTLFFSSNGHGGLGDADIFVAQRLYNSWNVWTKPVNLNSLNSGKFDAYFSLTSDSTIYFASNREGNLSDIYQSKITRKEYRDLYQVSESSNSTLKKKLAKVTESETKKFLGLAIPRVVYFNLNSYDLSPDDKELLYYIAGKLENDKVYSIELVGHTDEEGNSAYNMELSLKRAEAVKDHLVALGVDRRRIITVAKGATQPLVKTSASKRNEKNRRVEINLLK